MINLCAHYTRAFKIHAMLLKERLCHVIRVTYLVNYV